MKNFHFNNHPEIKEGQHAIFAPSQKLLSRSELTPEQLDNIIRSKYAAQIGTIIHAEAARMILQKKSVTKTKVADRIYDALWQANIPNKLNTPELYLDTVVPYIKDAIGEKWQHHLISWSSMLLISSWSITLIQKMFLLYCASTRMVKS